MDIDSVAQMVVGYVNQLGIAVLAIVTAVSGLAVAYLAFKFGWRSVKVSLVDGAAHTIPVMNFKDGMEAAAFHRGHQLNNGRYHKLTGDPIADFGNLSDAQVRRNRRQHKRDVAAGYSDI